MDEEKDVRQIESNAPPCHVEINQKNSIELGHFYLMNIPVYYTLFMHGKKHSY